MGRNSSKNWSFLICLTLILTTFAVFYQVYRFKFVVYDDPVYVSKNPNIQAGITLKTIKWAFTAGYANNWHPLTWLSHMLDWQLFGTDAGGHHLTNLVFHIANTLLLFIVLKQMTHMLWPSAFVAALFALHPLHVQSVAWVSERKDVLSTFFWFLTMWAYVRFANRPKIADYLLVVAFLALGLMAKPMLVTLPFVLLLLDYWPLDRFSPKRGKAGLRLSYLLIEKVPLFAIVLASCIITFIVQRKSGAMRPIEICSLSVRFANASISYLRYIIKMIWPARLAVYYPHPGQDVSILYAVISAAVLLAVTILILRLAAERRYLVTGWFWYLGTLVPVIGLVQVGSQAMADRYSYITLTGLFIIIAWGLPDLLAKWRYKKIALASSALLIVSAVSLCTHFQLGYWRNNISLFQHALDVTEDNYTAHVCISESLCEQGRLDEAIYHYREAIRIKSELLPAHLRLAGVLCDAGRLDEAVSESRKCLQMQPNDPNVLNTLGIALGQQGKFSEAVRYLTEALRIDPDFADAHTNLGYAMTFQGSLDEAVVHLVKALRLDPNSALAHYHFGKALERKGKISEAITHFEEALWLKPDWVEPMNDLAWFLAASKETSIHNPDKAVRLALRACELTGYKKPVLLDTLAVSYAATGAFDKAVETAEKALELCQSSGQETFKDEIKNRLVLYKAGIPYVESQ
jgi:tetratricopeptide (TPR) repeat protein